MAGRKPTAKSQATPVTPAKVYDVSGEPPAAEPAAAPKRRGRPPKAKPEAANMPALIDSVPTEMRGKVAAKREAASEAIVEFISMPRLTGDEFDEQYRAMFEQACSIAKRLEDGIQNSKRKVSNRDIYALNTLYSQIREIIADMRATKDMTSVLEELKSVVLKPFVDACAQSVIDAFHANHTNITHMVKNEDIREELLKRLRNASADAGAHMQEEYEKMLTRLQGVIA